MKYIKNGSLPIAVICLFLFLFPTFTFAHAYILKSSPSENEIVNQAPKKVTIKFDEAIQPSFNSLKVYDGKGNRVDQNNGRIDSKNPSTIEASLNENLPNGTYSINWRVVSSDGHPVEGVIPFQIGNGVTSNEGATVEKKSKGYTPHFDMMMIRWLQYISNAGFVGVLLLYLFVLPKKLLENPWVRTMFSRIIVFCYIGILISILLSFPLQATVEAGLSWNKVFRFKVLSDMFSNTLFGEIWMIQIATLLFLFLTTYLLIKRNLKPLWVWISFILGIGLLLAKSFTSHASSAANVLVSITTDFIHLLSASIWIGCLMGLVALIPLSRKNDTKQLYLISIQKFSKWGILLVTLLTLTGFYSSLSYIPNFQTLFTTNYGRVLSFKIILLVVMIMFATVNLIKGKRNNEKGLQTTLWGELIPGIVVLVLSVFLTNLPTAMSSPGPFMKTNTVMNDKKITLEATPNVIGQNEYAVKLKDGKGQPIKDIEQATLTFTSLEMDMGEETIKLTKVKEGSYHGKGMNFNMAGRWNVHVHVLTKDLSNLDTDFKVFVGSQ